MQSEPEYETICHPYKDWTIVEIRCAGDVSSIYQIFDTQGEQRGIDYATLYHARSAISNMRRVDV